MAMRSIPWDVQREWVARVLRLIGPGATVLDAPCGTGRYFPMLAAAGVRVAGVDQSAAMLARARERGIAVSLEHISLQELSYAGRFDAVLTIDAMQHIPPEDWPGVLANLHRAARPGGSVYLTVHELDASGHEKIPVCGQLAPAVRSSEFPVRGHEISRRAACPDASDPSGMGGFEVTVSRPSSRRDRDQVWQGDHGDSRGI
jgi:SAM-dependent methyltransferase